MAEKTVTADGRPERCVVTVRSEIFRGEGDTDSFETFCEGTYTRSGGGYVIAYDETLEDAVVPNRITVSGGTVTVERADALRLDIAPGAEREGLYRLPFGVIDMRYTGKSVQYELDENGGTLEFSYSMDIGGVASENSVSLAVTAGQ